MVVHSNKHRDPNCRPCDLHGHVWKGYADFSRECLSCGIYVGPDVAMVEALIREGAGGRDYRKNAITLGHTRPDGIPFLALPTAPKVAKPPAFAGNEVPSLWVVLPIAAAIGCGLGLLAWAIVRGAVL